MMDNFFLQQYAIKKDPKMASNPNNNKAREIEIKLKVLEVLHYKIDEFKHEKLTSETVEKMSHALNSLIYDQLHANGLQAPHVLADVNYKKEKELLLRKLSDTEEQIREIDSKLAAQSPDSLTITLLNLETGERI